MRPSSVVRSSIRRALALLLGCVLAVSWLGSARAMCAMTAGHRMGAAMEHPVAAHAHGTTMPGMWSASARPEDTGSMDVARTQRAPAPRSRGHAPTDDGCPMHEPGNSPCTASAASQTRHDGLHGLLGGHAAGRAPASGSSSGTIPSDCAVAAHCAELTVAAVDPVVVVMATATVRVTRVRADGPLLGASELAVEPTAPPPRG